MLVDGVLVAIYMIIFLFNVCVGLLLCYGLFDCAFLFSVSLGCLCGVVVLC